MNPSIKATLTNTISALENKSRETSDADFNVRSASARALDAQRSITSKETTLQARENSLDDVNQKLANPPMKEVSKGGKEGGTLKVVDEEEVKKLKADQKNLTGLIDQARNDVETAKQEAQNASSDALQAAGVRQDVIQEASELQSRVSSMQRSLSEGKTIPDQDLTKLATDINNLAGKFTKEDNKADVLGNVIYDPLAKDLRNIIRSIERNNNPPDPNTPPPEGSVNRKLFDVGIKGEPQSKIINLMERAAQRSLQIDGGQSFTKDQMRTMFTEYKSFTSDLTDTQKNSDVIKGFKTDMEALVTKSGHADILTENGG